MLVSRSATAVAGICTASTLGPSWSSRYPSSAGENDEACWNRTASTNSTAACGRLASHGSAPIKTRQQQVLADPDPERPAKGRDAVHPAEVFQRKGVIDGAGAVQQAPGDQAGVGFGDLQGRGDRREMPGDQRAADGQACAVLVKQQRRVRRVEHGQVEEDRFVKRTIVGVGRIERGVQGGPPAQHLQHVERQAVGQAFERRHLHQRLGGELGLREDGQNPAQLPDGPAGLAEQAHEPLKAIPGLFRQRLRVVELAVDDIAQHRAVDVAGRFGVAEIDAKPAGGLDKRRLEQLQQLVVGQAAPFEEFGYARRGQCASWVW